MLLEVLVLYHACVFLIFPFPVKKLFFLYFIVSHFGAFPIPTSVPFPAHFRSKTLSRFPFHGPFPVHFRPFPKKVGLAHPEFRVTTDHHLCCSCQPLDSLSSTSLPPVPAASRVLGAQLYCTLLYVLHCAALCCTVLFCIVLYCTALCCTGLRPS